MLELIISLLSFHLFSWINERKAPNDFEGVLSHGPVTLRKMDSNSDDERLGRSLSPVLSQEVLSNLLCGYGEDTEPWTPPTSAAKDVYLEVGYSPSVAGIIRAM